MIYRLFFILSILALMIIVFLFGYDIGKFQGMLKAYNEQLKLIDEALKLKQKKNGKTKT